MSEVKVNKISPRTNCGTVQLGDSGDTITIPAGATITNNGTQTGFGRTGTVDWDTTAKTASFTAVSGNGYFVDTTSGAITVTLPASPSAGDIVAVKDYAGTFLSNSCTVARNGSNIRGATNNIEFTLDNSGATFIYVDATEGWQYWVDGSDSDAESPFILATGGTITTCGNFKIHTFTGPGTFTVSKIACCSSNNEVSHLVIAGGGSGAAAGAGGGGAGGFRESKSPVDSYTASPLEGGTAVTVTAQAYPITVGAGGASATSPNPCAAKLGNTGNNSIFSTITSAGGGAGRYDGGPASCGQGGSGGGSGWNSPGASSGNTPPVSPPQGQNGGTVPSPTAGPMRGGGGGGGAGAIGQNGTSSPTTKAGDGGAGVSTSISGSSVQRAGGGGGGGNVTAWSTPKGAGGAGGGGQGGGVGDPAGSCGSAGTVNTGGGGGGSCSSNGCATSGAGGSGIVIIRYKYQ